MNDAKGRVEKNLRKNRLKNCCVSDGLELQEDEKLFMMCFCVLDTKKG
jgi:hypothetical protein